MEPLKHFGINIGKDKFHEASIYGLACVYLVIEKEISNYLRPFNLTLAKFNALMVIKHQGKENGLSQIEIGRYLVVSASNMTRLLDKLNREGFIERLAEEGDRRINRIKITQKGSAILDKLWPGYYKKITEIANLLDIQDLKHVSSLLIKWFVRLEGNSKARKFNANGGGNGKRFS